MNDKQLAKARRFADLHVNGSPLVLYNVWDAGGAKAVASAGAPAIATGSWSVAAAHGFEDCENIPLDLALNVAERIVASVDVPVTIDFEGGYAQTPREVGANAGRLIAVGVAGLNFEDQVVGGDGLYTVSQQAQRIEAIREAAEAANIPLFINARTDVFLKADNLEAHEGLLDEAIARAKAYRDAGASGFFAPGLIGENLISRLCEASPLPVNIMMMEGAPPLPRLSRLGVARVSFGPLPFTQMMTILEERARAIFTQGEALSA